MRAGDWTHIPEDREYAIVDALEPRVELISPAHQQENAKNHADQPGACIHKERGVVSCDRAAHIRNECIREFKSSAQGEREDETASRAFMCRGKRRRTCVHLRTYHVKRPINIA